MRETTVALLVMTVTVASRRISPSLLLFDVGDLATIL